MLIQWPDDNADYAGTVQHLRFDDSVTVIYCDHDRKRLNFPGRNGHLENLGMSASTSQSVNSRLRVPRVVDAESDDLKLIDDHFGKKRFTEYQAQGFEQYTLKNFYDAKKTSFLKTVKTVPHSGLPSDANIVKSHVLYKVKKNDDGSLKLKA